MPSARPTRSPRANTAARAWDWPSAAQLATLMGGEIGVDSVVGRGSIFWFEVRLEPVVEATPTLTRLPRMNLVGLRALIVDDNASNREILAAASAVMGRRGGRRGNQRRRRWPRCNTGDGPRFDFALLDDQMPGMDGIRAGETHPSGSAAGRHCASSCSPRATTHDSDSESVQLFAAILTKPLRRSQLLNCVTRVMTAAAGTGAGRRRRDAGAAAPPPAARGSVPKNSAGRGQSREPRGGCRHAREPGLRRAMPRRTAGWPSRR